MAYMNIFRIKSMEPRCLDGSAWLRIEGDEDQLSLHVDYRLAEMLADAFAKYKAMGTQDAAAEGEAA